MEENKMTGTYDMSGLRLAFFGMLFTVINIRIQGFDIVPDLIGYIMVIVGLGRIEKYEAGFTSAKKPAYVLAVLSLFNIIQVQGSWDSWSAGNPTDFSSGGYVNFSAGVFGGIPWLAILFMIVGTLANIYFAYHMCMAMKNLLLRVGDETLAMVCDGRWKLILAAEGGMLISAFSVMFGIPLGIFLTLIFAILALVAVVLFLLLIHHTWKRIDSQPESFGGRPEPRIGSDPLSFERNDSSHE